MVENQTNTNTNPVTLPSPPKTSTLPIVLLLILVILSLGGVGFLYWQNQQLTKQIALLTRQKSNSAAIPSPTKNLSAVTSDAPSPITIPTNWRTYKSQNGYSIKYPPQFTLRTGEWEEAGQKYGLQKEDEAILRFTEPNQPPHGGFPYGATISVKAPVKNPNRLSAVEWANQQAKDLSNYQIEYSINPVIISGIEAAALTYTFESRQTRYFIPYQNSIYEVLAVDFLPTQSPTTTTPKLSFDYDQLYQQIIGTVKFP